MGITTKDLAALCGVSRTTVHRALSGEGRIHPDTKEMILRTAKEQGYRPDLLARGLVKGKTYNIGIVVLDVRNRYFAEMLSTIGAEMNRRGYCMNIMLHDDKKKLEQEQMTRLAAYHMDGIILSSVNEGDAYYKFLSSLDVPIVTVDNKIVEELPFVSIDQRSAMREAASCLLEKGYQKIVYVCPMLQEGEMQNLYVHRERAAGFAERMQEAPEAEAVYLTDWEYLSQVRDQLDEKKRTAFLCAADSFALDIMKILRKYGKEPKRDYGIMGFDNIDTLDYVSPRLSTVSNSVREIAAAAVELLFALIEGEDQTMGYHRILPHQLITGETI